MAEFGISNIDITESHEMSLRQLMRTCEVMAEVDPSEDGLDRIVETALDILEQARPYTWTKSHIASLSFHLDRLKLEDVAGETVPTGLLRLMAYREDIFTVDRIKCVALRRHQVNQAERRYDEELKMLLGN